MANRYWIGGTGNWSDATNHWSNSSGGSPNAIYLPTFADDVFFDANSFGSSGQIVTLDGVVNSIKSMNWTGATNSPTFTGAVSAQLRLYDGSLTLISAMTYSLAGSLSFLTLAASGAVANITTNGKTLTNSSIAWSNGGASGGSTINLLDNFSCTSQITLGSWVTLNTNNFNVSCSTFSCSAPANTTTINMGSGTWTLTNSPSGNVTVWQTIGTNVVINASTSTIKIINNGTGRTRFRGGGFTFNNIWFTGSGNNTHTIYINSNTFNDIKVDVKCTLEFEAGTTQTVSSFTVSGTSGNAITLKSTSDGNQWTISKSSGTVNCDWLDLKDSNATGGATFNATNTIDSGNNTGWNITPPPSSSFFLLF